MRLCHALTHPPTHPFYQTFLDEKEVADRVLSVVKNFEKVEPGKVTATARFKEDLSLDSLDVVEVRERKREWVGGLVDGTGKTQAVRLQLLVGWWMNEYEWGRYATSFRFTQPTHPTHSPHPNPRQT